jgi:hypothetical protein
MALYILDVLALPRTGGVLVRGIGASDAPVGIEGLEGLGGGWVVFAEAVGETGVAWGAAGGVLAQGEGGQVAGDVGVGVGGPGGGPVGDGVAGAVWGGGEGGG